MKPLNDKVRNKYETGFLELTNRHSHIFEYNLSSTISTATNYKISLLEDMITESLHQHSRTLTRLVTQGCFRPLCRNTNKIPYTFTQCINGTNAEDIRYQLMQTCK